VYKQLVDLFPYAFTSFIEELMGVFLTPYLCLWHIPDSCDRMLQFLKSNSQSYKDIGVVCSQAKFNFVEHGNPKCDSAFLLRISVKILIPTLPFPCLSLAADMVVHTLPQRSVSPTMARPLDSCPFHKLHSKPLTAFVIQAKWKSLSFPTPLATPTLLLSLTATACSSM
jgi:hypothetical protein